MPQRRHTSSLGAESRPSIQTSVVSEPMTREQFQAACEQACGLEPGTLSPDRVRARMAIAEEMREKYVSRCMDRAFGEKD
jgi:hypothetical protein